MYLIGDIGNTDIKICLFNQNLKLINQVRFKTVLSNKNYLEKNLRFIKKYKLDIKKVLFSSVVPVIYKGIKNIIEKTIKVKCTELKQLRLDKLVKIKVFCAMVPPLFQLSLCVWLNYDFLK